MSARLVWHFSVAENPVPPRRRVAKGGCGGGRIRTCDLEGMNLASYRAAPLRDVVLRCKVGEGLQPCKTECKVFTLYFHAPPVCANFAS